MKGMRNNVRRSTRKEVEKEVVVTSSHRTESELTRLPSGAVKRVKNEN